MTREQILALPASEILELARQLRIGYQFKHTMRCATKRDPKVHMESDAEHIFALHYLDFFFRPLEDPEYKLNDRRIGRMITFHDIGEIPGGDVPYHLKTAAHYAKEREDAKNVIATLPAPMQDAAREGWREYDEGESPEARYVNALDKLEPQFELFDPVNEQSLVRIKVTYEQHVTKKFAAMRNFPVMGRFVEVMSDDMLRRDVFWHPTRVPALQE